MNTATENVREQLTRLEAKMQTTAGVPVFLGIAAVFMLLAWLAFGFETQPPVVEVKKTIALTQ